MSSPAPPPPLFKKRTTNNASRKKPPPKPTHSPSSSSSSSSDIDEPTRQRKRQRLNLPNTTSSTTAGTTSNPTPQAQQPDLTTTTKYAGDRSAHIASTTDDAAFKTARTFGPTKTNPANVRAITVTDFAPDVCKDYKQTGFCGFGDGCKFLHAREDYKQGWELDKEWEKAGPSSSRRSKPSHHHQPKNPPSTSTTAQDNNSEQEVDEETEDALLEGIPFACILCRNPYTDPVVTRCGHYFCEACALRRYRRSPGCAACGAGTGGVFNGAKGLRRLLERKRERAKAKRERGEEVAGEEEEEEGIEGEG
ncbi:MAG: hypothetical protein LQ344_006564 [Seirophora lacunosa]|nr:MAG: hypothetical protein LQ344_006564 [Seirophora lacunosa]